MNPIDTELAFEIVDLALVVAKTQTSGKVQEGINLADTLVKIGEKVEQAYQQHTGEMLNPLLIKVEKLE